MKKTTLTITNLFKIKTSFVLMFLFLIMHGQAQIQFGAAYDLDNYPVLESYFPFEKNTNDYSAFKAHLTSVDAFLTTDKNGFSDGAYQFNGSSSYMYNTAGYNWVSSGKYTINLWVNSSNALASYRSVMFFQGDPTRDLSLGFKNNRFFFSNTDGGYTNEFISTDSLNSNQWYMLTANVTDTTVALFINGNPVSFTTNTDFGIVPKLQAFHHFVGAIDTSGTYAFNGLIDDIKVFGTLLTPVQIMDMYTYENSNLRHVHFGVDMAYQIGLGKFDTINDHMDVSGSFNGWEAPDSMVHQGSGYYIYKLHDRFIGDELQFKFRINHDWGNAEFPELGGEGNRQWIVEDRINSISYVYNDEEFNDNLAIISVDKPANTSTSNADSITVTVKNLGYNFIEGFQLSYEFDGGVAVTNTVETGLAFAQEYTHTFASTIDVSTQGVHTLKIYTNFADENPEDDTVYHSIANLPLASGLPYAQDFEQADHNWFIGGVNPSWARGLPSKSVINSVASGSNAFVTGLTANIVPNEKSYVISPRFSGPFTDPVVEFSYFCHSNWQAGAAIQYTTDGGNTWTRLANNWTVHNGNEDDVAALAWSGDQAGFIGYFNHWKRVKFNMNGQLASASEVIFRFAFGSEQGLNQPSNGFAFDDFNFYEKPATDLALFNASVNDHRNPDGKEHISVEVSNQGTQDITGWYIEAKLNNSQVFTNDFTDYNIPAGETAWEGVDIDLSSLPDGVYNITLVASATGDMNLGNDTLYFTGVKTPTITTFPFVDNFEGSILQWNIFNDDHDADKIIEIGMPSGDYLTSVYSGSNAMASNVIGDGGYRTTAIATSPWMDLNGMFRPTIEFAAMLEFTPDAYNASGLQYRSRNSDWQQLGYNNIDWYNTYLDEGHAIYFRNQTEGWANIVDTAWGVVSQAFPEIGNKGEVQFRFIYSVGDNWNGSDGFAIDDFKVYDNPHSDDLALLKIESPLGGIANAGNDSVKLLLQNQGTTFATGFNIMFSFDTVSLSEVVSDTIWPGQLYVYTFPQTVNLSTVGQYYCNASIYHNADLNSANDYISKAINVLPLLSSPPYAFNFESGTQNWMTGSLGISVGSFEHGMAYGQIISDTTNNSFVTSLGSFYYAEELSYVQSPFMDLSTFTAPRVSIDVWSQIMDFDDGAALQYTTDNGTSWKNIGSNGSGIGWFNHTSDQSQGGLARIGIYEYWTQEMWGWQFAQHSIAELAGESSVGFRIIFGSDKDDNDYEGFAFDNFSIQEAPFGLTEDFNDNTLTNWDAEPAYTLTETGGELMVDCAGKSEWEAFSFNVDMSISENPYLAVRLKSDSALFVRLNYVDANGIWSDRYNPNGFNVPGDGLYHDYYWDFTNKLLNWENTPLDPNRIMNVAIQFNPNGTFDGTVYIDDLKLGADAALTNNIKLFWTQLGSNCHNGPSPVEVRFTNTGMNSLSGFEVSYSVDSLVIATETINDTLHPGDTLFHTFATQFDFSNGSADYVDYYNIQSYVNHASDEYPSDNNNNFNYQVFSNNHLDMQGWTSFNTCDGMADNNVWAVVESSDGNIWMSGFKGVSRYNGTNFIQYHETDGLASEYSWSMEAASNGSVWLPSTKGGFTQWNGTGFVTHYPFDTLVFEECSFEDPSGNMWFGSYQGHGVAKFNGTTWTQYKDEVGPIVEDIDLAPNGNILFANQGAVMQYNGSTFTTFAFDSLVRTDSYVNEIYRDANGITWFYGNGLLTSFNGSVFVDHSVNVESIGNIQAIEGDANGKVWFGGDNGAASFDGITWNYLYHGSGIIQDKIWSITIAADKSVWFGTRKGVSRYIEGPKLLVKYDMSNIMVAGLFNPAKDFVDVAGTFNDWTGTMLEDQDGDSIFEAMVSGFWIGDTIRYKARVNGDWCQPHEFSFGGEDRSMIITTDVDTVSHLFDDKTASDDISFKNISINLDMRKMIYNGDFTPGVDQIIVRGGFTCWNEYVLQDNDADFVYGIGIDSMYAEIGDTIGFEFNINDSIFEWVGHRMHVIQGINSASNFIWNNDGTPIANFDYLLTDLNVDFYNQSAVFTDTADYFWSFGDNQSSTKYEPQHMYSSPGSYEVCLKVTDSKGEVSSYCQWLDVLGDTTQAYCLAKFDFHVSGDTLYTVNNSSGKITAYFWDFGDNNSSNEFEPIHYFEKGGYYDVTLNVYDSTSDCFNFITHQVIIEKGEAICYADFVYQKDQSTVYFASTVEGNPNTYYWDFGDGSYSSEQNPSHTFKDGVFNVCLTVYNDTTNCFDEICKSIEVFTDTASWCYADFEYIVSGANVDFVSKSGGNITNYFWDFDDGFTDTIMNPTHTYISSGYYQVALTVYDSNTDCFNTKNKVIFIMVPEDTTVTCQADFGFVVTNNNVTFNNKSSSENAEYFWEFGDGNYETLKNPSHSYAKAGYYQVCLSVYDTATECISDYCKVIFVESGDTTDVCFASYNYYIKNTQVDFRSNVSKGITDYYWDFGDGSYSSDSNVVHTFENPGFHEVWLTVYNENTNCLSEYFDVIFIDDSLYTSCNADFKKFVNKGTVTFTNNSEGTFQEVFWDFGNGNYSTEINPKHTYKKNGYYNVCMAVFDTATGCYDELCKIIPITEVSNQVTCNANYDFFKQGLSVNFKGHVLGNVTNYFWDFGDGNYGYDSVMTHTYNRSGYYGVSFTVLNDTTNCLDEYFSVIFVEDSTKIACNANYTAFSKERKVTFTNKSKGAKITDYFWDFGDGNYSDEMSPVHVYNKPGFYGVELTIFDDSTGCIDTYFDGITVIDTSQAICQANFSFFANGNTVTYTEKTKGEITDLFWDLGDGNYSTDSVVTHTYQKPGYYEVILTTYNSETDCIDEYIDVVVVDIGESICKSEFTYYPDGYKVTFTPKATGDFKQYFWDFDDGSNSNDSIAVHTFDEPGYYEVAFTVLDTTPGGCFDTRFKIIFVEDQSGGSSTVELKPKFSHINTTGTDSVSFKDESLGDVSSWYWDFGDNSPASLIQHPVYEYDTNDYYRVCLTVGNDINQKTRCKFIAVGDVSKSITSFFTYYADSVTSTAHFKNKSLGDIVAYHWDFGDSYSSTQPDPSHTYADTGFYAVCLTTTSSSGTTKTYCKDVNVGNTLENPCLFSCVWPGDANNDLEANHYDIMTIGLNYGMEGPKRENATTDWYGQFAQNWSTYQLDGTNNKHGDCNGDGIINMDDTLAIDLNFAFSHTYQPDYKVPNPEWLIKCIWNNDDEKAVGSKSKAVAILSPPGKATGDLYAIAYEIEVIGGEKIIWSTVEFNFDNSWIGEDGVNMLSVSNIDSTQNLIYIGSTRIDHQNVLGSGEIAQISFNLKEGETRAGISFNVTTRGGIVATGETVTVDGSIELIMPSPVEICKGEVAILDAGVGFDSYIWSTDINNNNIIATDTNRIMVDTAGIFIITVADSTGATAMDSIVVIVNDLPTFEFGDDISAFDSTIIDAGADYAAYQWSTGDTTRTIVVHESGNYWLQVFNESGCSASDTIGVTITPTFNLELSSPVEICDGDLAILDAGSGYQSYIWSTGVTDTSRIEVSEAGNYYVTVTDNDGAVGNDTIEVIVHELPIVDLGDDVIQKDSVMLDAGSDFSTYLWSTGDDTQTIMIKESGDYWVQVTNEYGCSASDTISVTINVGIFEDISENIAVYPNPNNGKFWLVYEFSSTTHPVVEIINVNGETVWRNESLNDNRKRNLVEIDNLKQGVYYVKIIDDGKMGTLRFVVL